MGNPQSKAAEQMTSSDVPADQMEGTNVDDYNLQRDTHDIDEIYPNSPEWMILEQTEQPVLPQLTDGVKLDSTGPYGMFICEPSTQFDTMLPAASTMIALEPGEHVGTSNENPTTPQGTPSGAEGIASSASVKEDKNQRRRNRDKARRDSLTPEQREEMNARRRASRKNKSNEDRNASQRVARQNLTTTRRG